jgi:hypothetical protein
MNVRRFVSPLDGPPEWHVVSSAELKEGAHDDLTLYSRGKAAGGLTLGRGDGERFVRVVLGLIEEGNLLGEKTALDRMIEETPVEDVLDRGSRLARLEVQHRFIAGRAAFARGEAMPTSVDALMDGIETGLFTIDKHALEYVLQARIDRLDAEARAAKGDSLGDVEALWAVAGVHTLAKIFGVFELLLLARHLSCDVKAPIPLVSDDEYP